MAGKNTVSMNLTGLQEVHSRLVTQLQNSVQSAREQVQEIQAAMQSELDGLEETYKAEYEAWEAECERINKANEAAIAKYNDELAQYATAVASYSAACAAAAKEGKAPSGSPPTPPVMPPLEPLPPMPIKNDGGLPPEIQKMATQYNQLCAVHNEIVTFTNGVMGFIEEVKEGEYSAYSTLKEYRFNNLLFGKSTEGIDTLLQALTDTAAADPNKYTDTPNIFIAEDSLTQKRKVPVGGDLFEYYPETYALKGQEVMIFNSSPDNAEQLSTFANGAAYDELIKKGISYFMIVAADIGLQFDSSYRFVEIKSETYRNTVGNSEEISALYKKDWSKLYGALQSLIRKGYYDAPVGDLGSYTVIKYDANGNIVEYIEGVTGDFEKYSEADGYIKVLESDLIIAQKSTDGKDIVYSDFNGNVYTADEIQSVAKDDDGNVVSIMVDGQTIYVQDTGTNCHAMNILNLLRTTTGADVDLFAGHEVCSWNQRSEAYDIDLRDALGIESTAGSDIDIRINAVANADGTNDISNSEVSTNVQQGKGVMLKFNYGTNSDKPHWVTIVDCKKTETGAVDIDNSVFFDPYTGKYRTGADLKYHYEGFSEQGWRSIDLRYTPCGV